MIDLIAYLPLAASAGFISFLSPCVFPLVPSYLAYIGGNATAAKRVRITNSLLGVYSLGLGVPFFLAALAFDRFLSVSKMLRKHLRLMEQIGGGIMLVMGVLMTTGYYTVFNGLLMGLTPDWPMERL